MVNYACAFSQSESRKYFEWIINIFINVAGAIIGCNSYYRLVGNHIESIIIDFIERILEK